MEILLWLAPAVAVTCAAMAWISWVARDRPDRQPSPADQERFAQAIMRPLPEDRRRRQQRAHSTGVAQRGVQAGPDTRRSA